MYKKTIKVSLFILADFNDSFVSRLMSLGSFNISSLINSMSYSFLQIDCRKAPFFRYRECVNENKIIVIFYGCTLYNKKTFVIPILSGIKMNLEKWRKRHG